VRRYIYLSVLSVHYVRDQLNFIGRYVILPLLLRNAAADHEVIEAMIKQSKLDWTIVPPPSLTDGPRTGEYRSGEKVAPKPLLPKISRADLADFMLAQLVDGMYLRGTPTIMY